MLGTEQLEDLLGHLLGNSRWLGSMGYKPPKEVFMVTRTWWIQVASEPVFFHGDLRAHGG